jgi:hypothetical protein
LHLQTGQVRLGQAGAALVEQEYGPMCPSRHRRKAPVVVTVAELTSDNDHRVGTGLAWRLDPYNEQPDLGAVWLVTSLRNGQVPAAHLLEDDCGDVAGT